MSTILLRGVSGLDVGIRGIRSRLRRCTSAIDDGDDTEGRKGHGYESNRLPFERKHLDTDEICKECVCVPYCGDITYTTRIALMTIGRCVLVHSRG